MKILACAGGAYIYGAEEVSLKVIGHLARAHEIHCAINGWNDGAFPARLDKMHVPYTAIKLGWLYLSKPLWTMDSLIHAPGGYFRYFFLIRRFRPDVYYHVSYRTIFQLYPFLGKNNVLHVHDAVSDNLSKKILRRIDSKVSLYIANSEWVRQGLVACGIDGRKVRLIYNGIKFDSSVLPAQAAVSERPVQIGFVGQVTPRKGLEILLRALAGLRKQDYDFRLHVYGNGDPAYISEMKNLAHSEGMGALVSFHGYVADKSRIYSGVDFCVVPSVLPESFGLTAVEPAVFGRCAIASKAGGLSEIIEDGVTGLLFEPGNADDLAVKLRMLLDDRGLIAQMGASARERYSIRFAEEDMLRKTEQALQDASKPQKV